ncbi:hypothetical protein [Pseudobacteriovorax antillogorgiicola]|uniref:Uncharacterized protein n=1 Tax=Pseudobacteriovorax antillogorgiicola TaxID=1513793 RepID=A0A1Y6BH40_9BACT|nr:hypothetical protein [Pseudobacteriovorax antillogorgiicola]TCS55516.1 hypothetical protein EDD56_105239 [Pseudobacteriovorax antillogorgiicola]SMF11414.1 hypothetical protein SAMN06296036_10585 [Pseudobacteriovorax antillogorgiicola]
MKLLAILFCLANLLGCQDQTLKGSANNTESVQSKESRPQETGEGLPGYLHCQSTEGDSETSLDCRLQEGDVKVDLSGKDVSWTLETPVDVQLDTRILASEEPWHVNFLLQGPIESRRSVISQGAVQITIDQESFDYSIPESLNSTNSPSGGVFQLLFGPSSSGRSSSWMGLNMDSATTTPVTTNMGSAIGNVQLELIPLDGASLTPEGPLANSGASPWSELGISAVSIEGSLEIRGQLPAGQYRISVIVGNAFLTSPATIELSSAAAASVPETTTLNAHDGSSLGETNFSRYESNEEGTFTFTISTNPIAKIGLHGLIIEPLTP